MMQMLSAVSKKRRHAALDASAMQYFIRLIFIRLPIPCTPHFARAAPFLMQSITLEKSSSDGAPLSSGVPVSILLVDDACATDL
jgi:hypothetical protein